VLSEKASRPNRLCGSCVAILGVQIGRPQIFFRNVRIFLSNLVIVGIE
jgi:hypothetical protein